MPTVRLNLVVAESDEVSKRDVRDIEQAVAFEEKYEATINLVEGAEDILVAPPQLAGSKVLVLTSSVAISVRLNDLLATEMTGVTMLVLSATGITGLYLSNESETTAKVAISLYGDA